MQAIVGVVMVLSLVVLLLSLRETTRTIDEANVETMGLALRHVAGNMQPLLEANRSAAAIADAAREPATNDEPSPASISQVRPKMFMAFAMQQVSYAGADGHAFAFYRTERDEARALFTDSQKRWCTQAVDPATGRLAAAALVATKNNASPPAASLWEGWARPGIRMLFFSAPVDSDAGGVVSASGEATFTRRAVAVHDVFEVAASRIGVQDGLDMYYAVGDDKDNFASATANYEPLLLGYQYRTADDTAEDTLTFSKLKCAASAIDDAAPELGQLVSGGPSTTGAPAGTPAPGPGPHAPGPVHRRDRPRVVSCAFAVRGLRRAAAREMALNADLVRQKEALRQAERKSMNKSNAFASASHDIRSALAAIAGVVDMSRPEAQALPAPGIVENLDQMGICTNKLFDILNSILDTSKVESGKMQLEEAEFSMADVLQESVDMANVTGVRRGVEVIWDPCDFSVLRCAAVLGDSKRFKQILDILLGNALKFTDDGHVLLRGWATRPIAGSGAALRQVVDTSIGIPKEKRLSVFENYVQVNNGQGGTGLGLGIVQSFVRLMGGDISIKDKEPGERGTCFAFNVLLKMSETWMESIGVKVWLVRQAEFIGSTLEKMQGNSMATAAADCGGADRCFSSKEMVNQLRNSTGPRRASLGGLLLEICQEMAKLARIKHEAPCKVVLLEDIKTPSSDLRRLKEQGCDLVLRKPVHGSHLFTLLMTLRDLQVSDAQAESSQVGPEIARNNSQQQEEIVPLPNHVIFMDCQMPNMDGYEATKLIREEERRYGIHTPIIALTAADTEEDLEKAMPGWICT
ncbi:unnamed protein product [Miscanthus lutarioriparius]|uniref:histidine kinase n=1 Tax=Miscanthus lutarioriparius TaxID=422564 RepID=A0A811S4S4_9POAL|nr:unnamed protein product [Miscanthus lutarioriparius]